MRQHYACHSISPGQFSQPDQVMPKPSPIKAAHQALIRQYASRLPCSNWNGYGTRNAHNPRPRDAHKPQFSHSNYLDLRRQFIRAAPALQFAMLWLCCVSGQRGADHTETHSIFHTRIRAMPSRTFCLLRLIVSNRELSINTGSVSPELRFYALQRESCDSDRGGYFGRMRMRLESHRLRRQ